MARHLLSERLQMIQFHRLKSSMLDYQGRGAGMGCKSMPRQKSGFRF